jgi:hypothetical protein
MAEGEEVRNCNVIVFTVSSGQLERRKKKKREGRE